MPNQFYEWNLRIFWHVIKKSSSCCLLSTLQQKRLDPVNPLHRWTNSNICDVDFLLKQLMAKTRWLFLQKSSNVDVRLGSKYAFLMYQRMSFRTFAILKVKKIIKIMKLWFGVAVYIKVFGLFMEELDVLLVEVEADWRGCSIRCACYSNVRCYCCVWCWRVVAVVIVDFALAVKENVDTFADFLCSSINISIKSSLFPSCVKFADVTPLEKKWWKDAKKKL